MTSKKTFPKGTLILFVSLVALLIIFYLTLTTANNSVPKDLIAVLRPLPTPLQPFTLADKDNQAFTNKQLNGKWSFIFFGYTHCPDICPTTLNTLKQVHNALKKHPKAISNLQVIFVSVDPERDKPKALAKYTEYFNKEFISVTGTEDNLLSFSRQFAAAYIKQPTKIPGDYLVSHTSSIFLVDPKSRIVASFSPPHYTETIASQYLTINGLF